MRDGPLFRNRAEAGRLLADRVRESVAGRNAVVLALPRGGVPVGIEVARTLGTEFDVFLVRKLGLPGCEELAIGAIASGGVRVLNENVIRELGVSPGTIDRIAQTEQRELERREQLYRRGRAPIPVANRTVVAVDDGLATGATMRAAVRALRLKGAARIIVAAPVAPPETCDDLRTEADEVICDRTPDPFGAVGHWYESFEQTTDEDVSALLFQSTLKSSEQTIQIPPAGLIGDALAADLAVPRDARGIVIFAHGSGSSRLSPRNRYVAGVLREAGLATLLPDLLTAAEEQLDDVTGRLRFDIGLLAARLADATAWLRSNPETSALRAGYFGASTGAAAALAAAAEARAGVAAIVSRGGRPDLAGPALREVTAPVLLIVGGNDTTVLEMNREAFGQLRCEKRLDVVPGATHLFEEPGALEHVARLAAEWFTQHLSIAV